MSKRIDLEAYEIGNAIIDTMGKTPTSNGELVSLVNESKAWGISHRDVDRGLAYLKRLGKIRFDRGLRAWVKP